MTNPDRNQRFHPTDRRPNQWVARLTFLAAGTWAALALRHYALERSWMGALTFDERSVWYAIAIEGAVAVLLYRWAVRLRDGLAPGSRLAVYLVTAATIAMAAVFVVTATNRMLRPARVAPASTPQALDRRLASAARVVASSEEDYFLANRRYGALHDLKLSGDGIPRSFLITVEASTVDWRIVVRDDSSGRVCALARGSIPGNIGGEGPQGDAVCADDARRLDAVRSVDAPPLSPVRAVATRSLLGASWPQYRGSAGRDSAAELRSDAPAWTANVFTPVRSTPIAVNGMVVVGGHATGILTALASENGRTIWATRLPNWIHQDPVVVDTIIAVGFGDNLGTDNISGPLSGPGGVSVHDLRTGRRIWTSTARGAVMPSPVVFRSTVVYATRSGDLISRDFRTGRLMWFQSLHSGFPMGSPALFDSLLLVPEAPRQLCTYLATTGRELWCASAPPGHNRIGDAPPTIANGIAYAATVRDSGGFEMLVHRSIRGKLAWLREHLASSTPEHLGDQELHAFDLSSGKRLWSARLGGGNRLFGHTSGTPVVEDGRVYIVSPVGQAVLSLDERTGTILWRTPMAGHVRGPVTLTSEGIFVADADGLLTILRRDDGTSRCRYRLPQGVDRAGPTLVGRSALFAGLRGMVSAIPIDTILAHCLPSASTP